MYIYGCNDESGENVLEEKGREWKLPHLLYADDLVLWGKLEGNLWAMVGYFPEICRRGGLEVNAGKIKVMVLSEEEGLEYEVCVICI